MVRLNAEVGTRRAHMGGKRGKGSLMEANFLAKGKNFKVNYWWDPL